MNSKPTGSSHPSLLMAGLSVAGGIAGFMKSGSRASLAGGGAVGTMFGISAYMINKNDDMAHLGYDLGYLSSMILVGKLAPGNLGKLSVRGGVAGAALAVGIYNGMKSFESKGII
mmetsp:Transcript_11573/g.18896  ORF Transcript_11573/g.18896 Transcript_11573/m.18896 type:complete len:115 (-) Transcript_11573:298-642(-)